MQQLDARSCLTLGVSARVLTWRTDRGLFACLTTTIQLLTHSASYVHRVGQERLQHTRTVITDIENQPVTVDSNPAHFDGFLGEIASFVERSGMYQELLEQGITFRGAKTVIESPAVIPFLRGSRRQP